MLFSTFFPLLSILLKTVLSSDQLPEDEVELFQSLIDFSDVEELPVLIQPEEYFEPLSNQLHLLLTAIRDKRDFARLLPGLPLQSIALGSKNSDTQCSLIHYAVRKENSRALAPLRDAGLNINAVDSCGISPLHVAVMYDLLDCIKELLRLGANQFLCSRDGVLPIFLSSSPEIVTLLIEACPAEKLPFLLNATMRDGTSLLEHFFYNQRVLNILERYCESIYPSYHFILRVFENVSIEAFIRFAMLFPARCLMALQGKGIDLAVWSIRQNQLGLLKRLIDSKAISVLYFTRTPEGNSLLHEAARLNRPVIVKFLIEIGCPRQILNGVMKSPAQLTNDPLIQSLLSFK